MQRFDYDVAILGGGSAGYAAARTAADAGLKTAVIEGGKEVGGLCILHGCMPTKALLYAAEVLHLASHTEPWGIRPGKVRFDFKKVMARKNALIKDFAAYRRQQLAGGKFEFIRANARFLDAHTVELTSQALVHEPGSSGDASAPSYPRQCQSRLTPTAAVRGIKARIRPGNSHPARRGEGARGTGEERFITARNFIIATGSSVAQFFARLGVKVTLIQRGEHILREFDTDAAVEIEKVFRREGIRIFTNTKLTGVKHDGRLKTVSFQHEGKTITASAGEILFALGRVPNTASLNLAGAGVASERGRIVANEFMQTSAPNIYAAGDCTGPHEIVHLAVQQGELAARNLAQPRRRRKMEYRLLISVVFTEPQAAFVGLTEKEAQARGIPHLAASHPFNDHGKSLIMEARDGFVKLLAGPKSGEILGGACVGPAGGELIHEIVAAMAKGMTVHELAVMPHYHPTLAEIWTYPAEELAAQFP
jgi:pyruvate/2-oxoglutarate dehydrogenase complex dihydrolipoamide dehydrogenase (E3) component